MKKGRENRPLNYREVGSDGFEALVTLLSFAATPTPRSASANGHTSSNGGRGIDSGHTPAYFKAYAANGIRAATVVFQLTNRFFISISFHERLSSRTILFMTGLVSLLNYQLHVNTTGMFDTRRGY